jgi:hypothetical protein
LRPYALKRQSCGLLCRHNVRSDSSSDEEFQKMEMGRAKRHRQGRSQRPSKRTLIEEDDEDEEEEDEVEDASDASDDDSHGGDEMEVDDDKEERSEVLSFSDCVCLAFAVCLLSTEVGN